MPDMIVPNSNPDVFNTRAFPGPVGAFHPENIEVPAGIEHPAFGIAREAFTYAHDGVEKVDVFRGTPNEEHRAARHDRETRELADQTQAAYNEKVTRAEGELARAHAEVEASLAAKAGLKADPNWRSQVVGVFYDMANDGARAAAIAGMIESGDNASLAALVEAPLVVTKLRPEVRDSIKERVFAKVDPQGVRLRDALAKAQTRLANAHVASFGIFDTLRADTHVGAAKERAAKAAARNMAANADARR